VHSVRDLSEQRRVEDAFRHLQRIEVLGQLAAAVAHDFNNLLSVITNDTFSLIAAHPPGDPDHDKLEEICGVVKRGKELTKQLLTLSRKEQQEQRVIDLNDTIRSFAPILKRLAGRDVTFAIRLERNVPRIYADECQIEQVLMNLVANARDAMPRGGTLRITTSGTAKPEWARLTVADTGAGMSPDVVARACEPFFTTKKDHGTGLGLAIVSGIVAQSRGRMGVESELDRGTTFTIELPAHQA
jgi:two-component system cell cycle sensor histidine kinase/response regulator CckA